MKRHWLLTSALFLLTFTNQPARASENFRDSSAVTTTAGFVGFQLRMNIRAGRAVPDGRLALGLVRYGNGRQTVPERSYVSSLAIGFSNHGKAEFYVADQRLNDVQQRLGIAPVAVVAFGIGAALAGAAMAVSSSADDSKPEVVCMGIEVCPPPPAN